MWGREVPLPSRTEAERTSAFFMPGIKSFWYKDLIDWKEDGGENVFYRGANGRRSCMKKGQNRLIASSNQVGVLFWGAVLLYGCSWMVRGRGVERCDGAMRRLSHGNGLS
jgi:hypothetical protein